MNRGDYAWPIEGFISAPPKNSMDNEKRPDSRAFIVYKEN